ncbi:MAG: coenzyme F420-0:L-glutamate ligase [Chloroflexi bacterium]|nr:coenzyme F420-0:L-glutamate ligase [Chloroflexota bacterium]
MSPESSKSASAGVPRVQVIGITGIPEIEPGDPLGETIVAAADRQGTPIEADDILVVTQKIVSKAEGRIEDLASIEPSAFAARFAHQTGRDARLVELVLRESRAIVRMDLERGILITETKHGFVCANAGIDASNVPGDDKVSLLPDDPDRSARAIREQVKATTGGTTVAVIISDTFGRAWREGHVNFAIGAAGINPIKDYRGTPDAQGMVLKVTSIAIADELAGAAELVTEKAVQVPVAIMRGYPYDPEPDGVGTLLRPRSRDLFR